jgi:predicted nucleic acid-binding protein
MRVVLDTNVVISALLFDGLPEILSRLPKAARPKVVRPLMLRDNGVVGSDI